MLNRLFGLFVLLIASSCTAAKIKANVYTTDQQHQLLGTIAFEDSPYGLLIIPNLANLPMGLHGFHLHEHANCSNQAMAAGGHFDPEKTKTHQGPYKSGHLGDLPVLYVDKTGQANTPILAPRLKTKQLNGLSIMIHEQGDNYTDNPTLGGGGGRIACGVLKFN